MTPEAVRIQLLTELAHDIGRGTLSSLARGLPRDGELGKLRWAYLRTIWLHQDQPLDPRDLFAAELASAPDHH